MRAPRPWCSTSAPKRQSAKALEGLKGEISGFGGTAQMLTPMQRTEHTGEMLAVANGGVPMKRHAEPEEAAALYVSLASDEAKYIAGRHMPIDGGETA